MAAPLVVALFSGGTNGGYGLREAASKWAQLVELKKLAPQTNGGFGGVAAMVNFLQGSLLAFQEEVNRGLMRLVSPKFSGRLDMESPV
jgi:hypothetical protein